MNDDDRITEIQRTISDRKLDSAMEGYREQAISAHPALQHNEQFNSSMKARQFIRALDDVRKACEIDGNEYLDVIRMLETVVAQRVTIMMM